MILGEYFGATVNNLEPIDTGQMSRLFSFGASQAFTQSADVRCRPSQKRTTG